ncbi:hypothetical protein HMPREF1039_0752 [Megasphaera lornae]|uniref:Uncharacterized protein n=1 Tax=Megasphaera lornae TaxID=1000568 RepID=A0ABN0CZU9_9FIRM|nr:hypothetical protein HMPREF1039_0752 [Megasphaera lornae]
MRIRNFLFFCVHPGRTGAPYGLSGVQGNYAAGGKEKKPDFLRPATYNKRRF